MSEEAKTKEPEVSKESTEVADPNEVQIDRTELERLRATQARIDALELNMGDFESLEDYQTELERVATEGLNKPAGDPPPTTPAEKSVEKPAVENQSQSVDNTTIMNELAQQRVRGDYNEYRYDQDRLPEDERSKFTKEQLVTNLWKNSALVGQVATQRGCNLVEASRLVLELDKGAIARQVAASKAEGIASEAAKVAAATSATLTTGGETSLPQEATAEEKSADEMEKRRREIAPPSRPFVIPK